MSLSVYKLLAALLIFLTSIAAIIYPIRARTKPSHHHFLELADAFASGIFLGAALFHMLPDARNEFSQLFGNLTLPLSEIICASGFLVLLFFERFTARYFIHSVSYALAFIIILHSFIEGTAIGVNTEKMAMLVLFLAIFAHKGSESFALAITLNKSTLSQRALILVVGLFALMTPIGILVGTSVDSSLPEHTSELTVAIINAFAAGTFLYMSTLHHINHHQRLHEKEGLLEFLALLIGLSVMAVLAVWA